MSTTGGAVRSFADDAPLTRTENGWNDPATIRTLIEKIVDILQHAERHAHGNESELAECCTIFTRRFHILDTAHDLYAPLLADVDPRYAEGHPPGTPPPSRSQEDSIVVIWFRRTVVKILDIVNSPERHDHYGMGELNECCAIDGRFDWALLIAHDVYATLGHNPMERCDALEGPCACGAWHKWGEPR